MLRLRRPGRARPGRAAGGRAGGAGPARGPPPVPAVGGERDTVVPFTNIRRRTAEHMVRSKHTSAHTMVAIEVDYSAVEQGAPGREGPLQGEAEGFGLTYLPFITRAVVDALAEFPNVNSSVGDDALIVHHDINLGIAVDLDFEGLLVPVIHDADGKRLRALAREISGLAGKARAKRLTMDDISGGTFTITNAGPFGTLITVPVINQPQVAILSTDGVRKSPVVVELPDGTDAIAIHPVGNLVLSLGPPGRSTAPTRRPSWREVKEILETAGLVRRAVTRRSPGAVLRVRWLGRVALPGRPRPPAGAVADRAATTGCCCWSTLTSTPWACGPSPSHVLVDPASVGRRAGPQPTGAATSPTTGPASWSATRSSRSPWAGTPRPCHVQRRRAVGDRRPRRPRPPGAGRLDGYPGVWLDAGGPTPRKICAIGRPGLARPFDARLRPQCRLPTWTFSTTSFRAGSATSR